MSDKEKYEGIDLNEQEEAALKAVWDRIENNSFPDDDEDEEDEDGVLV